MKAHLDAIGEALRALDYPAHPFAPPTGSLPPYYWLESGTGGTDPDVDLSDESTAFSMHVRVRSVSSTALGAAIMLDRAKGVLHKRHLHAPGRLLHLRWLRTEVVLEDDDFDPRLNQRVGWGVDTYTLTSQPKES